MEQFAIKSCILNSELPAKIRCHAVAQFNRNLYDIIIASDERALDQPKLKKEKRSKDSKPDKESGVARGIDFQRVSNVINFDFPLDVSSYVHRAGRTARGNNTGSVLSFADINEKPLLDAVEEHLKIGYAAESVIKNYQFKLEKVEAFRYRAKDAWRAITKVAIRDARVKEIKIEMFNCEKLRSFFENNPRDLQVLRHDKELGTVKKQAHLADVPDYIVPDELKRMSRPSSKLNKRKRPNSSKAKAAFQSKQNNPLLCAQLDYGKRQKK